MKRKLQAVVLIKELQDMVGGNAPNIDVTVHRLSMDTISMVKDAFKDRLVAEDVRGTSASWVCLRDKPGAMHKFEITMFYPAGYIPPMKQTKKGGE